MIKKIAPLLFSMITTVVLLMFAAIAMACATFIENNYDTSTAKILIYNSIWFELLLVLIGINIIGSIIRNKLFTKKKAAVFLFHFAFLVILAGAYITRHKGFEGIMHIREGMTSNTIQSSEKYISITTLHNNERHQYQKKVLFSSYTYHKFNHKLNLDDEQYKITLKEHYPSVIESITSDIKGAPHIKLVAFKSMNASKNYILKMNEKISIQGINIAFDKSTKNALHLFTVENKLYFNYSDTVYQLNFNNNESIKYIPSENHHLEINKFYHVNGINFAIKEFLISAKKTLVKAPKNTPYKTQNALIFNVSNKDFSEDITVFENHSSPATLKTGNTIFQFNFGKLTHTLPFTLRLNDFVFERYAGSNSPSSFKSYVSLIEQDSTTDMEIYMNNTLKHKGYRFFQTSYDKDELGTYLSVNYDWLGTNITYSGYFIMILGFLWLLVSPGSRFRSLIHKLNKLQAQHAKLFIAILGLFLLSIQNTKASVDSLIIDKEFAKSFEKLLVLNSKGRVEPVATLSSELLRKIHGKSDFNGYDASHWFLSVTINPEKWFEVPMIKVGNKKLQKHLGINTEYLAFKDAYTNQKVYKLKKLIEETYRKNPGERNKFDKEIIKLDERINIFIMMVNWEYLTIFPIEKDKNNTWEDLGTVISQKDSAYSKFATSSLMGYRNAVLAKDFNTANKYLSTISENQKAIGYANYPNAFKIKAEVFYIKWNLFKKLSLGYLFVGLFLLIFQIISILHPSLSLVKISKPGFIIVFFFFILHTLALALLWVIANHAPLSNAYETMLFISWSACLLGLILFKWSKMTISIATLLAAMALLVASMSWMNPQITNLQPVLKSLWLIIHVAVITSSYGFLGVSALLGLTNLILSIFKNQGNKLKINWQQNELVYIIQIANIIGLIMLAAGTVLGAIWANESWGRYWGWDPKETWALISVLVYTFITHMHMIKGLGGIFAQSTGSLFAFASILMTYFGVNYYLSGLHSYAQGEKTDLPIIVFLILFGIITITAFAAYKNIKTSTTIEN